MKYRKAGMEAIRFFSDYQNCHDFMISPTRTRARKKDPLPTHEMKMAIYVHIDQSTETRVGNTPVIRG